LSAAYFVYEYGFRVCFVFSAIWPFACHTDASRRSDFGRVLITKKRIVVVRHEDSLAGWYRNDRKRLWSIIFFFILPTKNHPDWLTVFKKKIKNNMFYKLFRFAIVLNEANTVLSFKNTMETVEFFFFF